MLASSQAAGRLSPEIVAFLRRYCLRRLDVPFSDGEEIVSSVLRRFSAKWEGMDVSSNPLAFVGSMLYWERKSHFRRLQKRKRMILYECELGECDGRKFAFAECPA